MKHHDRRRKRLGQVIGCSTVIALVLTCQSGPQAQQSNATYPPDIVRLLDQATFGPTVDSVQHAADRGVEAWISEQFNTPLTPYPSLPHMPSTRPTSCTGTCARDNYSMYPLQVYFFNNALTGADQLRQRVAFALSQIFVVSALSNVTLPSWMGPYQQLLYQDAFTNYRQLLTDVTLSPAMGSFLNVLNNKKLNPTTGVKPNENYAREVLQLFSIGLVMLNPDGTPMLDENGQQIPTYDQATVEEFARVFTGWTLRPAFGAGIPNYQDRMIQHVVNNVEVDHDNGSKTLLGGEVFPDGVSAAQDLYDAIDNIAEHPNVGPFIGKQLIQHLVTSNPSPAYVARVSAAWADNGYGTSGDIPTVVWAILTDPEARGDFHAEPNYGHLVEPALFITRVLRAFNAKSDGVLNPYSANMEQDLFRAASVFNFYPPGYRIVGGNGLLGPEFKLQDSQSALTRINFVNTVVFGGIPPAPPDRPTGTTLDLSRLNALASNSGALVDELNGFLMHGAMSQAMHDAIVGAVEAVPVSNLPMRVQTAVYLVASSSQYQVEQ
jgi:uncharacterized protein (DUF1800 family)